MNASAELTFRPHGNEDLPFIHDSWGSSYYKGSAHSKFLTPDEFHRFHRPIRKRFLARDGAQVLIGANPEDSWHIAGWLGFESLPSGLLVQYIYVREIARRQGVASALIQNAIRTSPVFFTHLTSKGSAMLAKNYARFMDWKHVPHLV